jgi:hypothetical protein
MWLVTEYEISTVTCIWFPICVLAFKKSGLDSNAFCLFDCTVNILYKLSKNKIEIREPSITISDSSIIVISQKNVDMN